MKIIFISDTHNQHNLIPTHYLDNTDGSVDTIIHAGDVSSRGTEDEIKVFLNWFSKLPFKNKIFIPGNHDWFFERVSKHIIDYTMSKYPEVVLLNDSGIEIDGIKIWGSAITPYFGGWAFNRVGEEIKKHWDMIPEDTNILITHGGPLGIGYNNVTLEGQDVGCPYLAIKITELSDLKIFCQGHIHEGYGSYQIDNGPLFLNASVLNRRYKMCNKPIIVDYNKLEVINFG